MKWKILIKIQSTLFSLLLFCFNANILFHQLFLVEAGNRNTPEALHVIHSSLKQLDSNVTMLYIDARKSITDIENITSEVSSFEIFKVSVIFFYLYLLSNFYRSRCLYVNS